jgi:hypothetical protein
MKVCSSSAGAVNRAVSSSFRCREPEISMRRLRLHRSAKPTNSPTRHDILHFDRHGTTHWQTRRR